MLSLSAVGVSLRTVDGTGILDSVDIEFHSNELVVLAGQNGAGKSMLVRCLLGLTKPSAGRVLLDGREISCSRRELRRRVGLVFQESHLQIIGQTVLEDVELTPRAMGFTNQKVESLTARALMVAGLENKRELDPHVLSGGERRRLCLAAVLAHNPELVFLDEPLVSLDRPSAATFVKAMLHARSEGRGVVVVTHDVERFLHAADRLVLLDHGRLIAAGGPQEILQQAEQLDLVSTKRSPV